MKELLDALKIIDYKELLSAHIKLVINTGKYNWISLNINEYDYFLLNISININTIRVKLNLNRALRFGTLKK